MARLDRAALFRLAASARFETAVRSLAPAEALARRRAGRYVAGATEEDAVQRALGLAEAGIGASLDLFGEQVTDPGEAAQIVESYVTLAGRLAELPPSVWLAVDLSHIGLDLDVRECRASLERIAAALPPGRLIQVGAEDFARADRVFEVVLPLARAGAPVGATLQANLRRSDRDADVLAESGVHVRLVKGAYLEPAAIARPYGDETDLAFIELAHRLAGAGVPLALATHDLVILDALLRALTDAECEFLLGVREEDARRLAAAGRSVRVYVPFGGNWFRYWMRRVAESRGA